MRDEAGERRDEAGERRDEAGERREPTEAGQAPSLVLDGVRGAVFELDVLLAADEPRGPGEEATRSCDAAVALLRRLRDAGVRVAVATERCHAAELLARAGIGKEVDAVVDGQAMSAMGLAGWPAPDTLLEAAARLGVPPGRCLAVGVRPRGMEAGSAGGFRTVALDRNGRRSDLAAAGAALVVDDLEALELTGSGPALDACLVAEPDGDDEREGIREAIFTLANGYVGTRGARSYVRDDGRHYPGTYLAGVFDRMSSVVDGRVVDEDALVNAPNWLSLSLSMDNGPWLGAEGLEVVPLGIELDVASGVLVRRFAVVDGKGRRSSLVERRLASMADPHLVASETSIVAENWSGPLEVHAGLDGSVAGSETIEERLLGGRHLELSDAGADGELVHLAVRTVQSQVIVAEAMRARLLGAPAASEVERDGVRAGRRFSLEIVEGQRVVCEKVVAVYTSRDPAIADPPSAARSAVRGAGGFGELAAAHEAAWARLWSRSSVIVRDETSDVQRLVNLHLYHVLQVASPHVVDHDVGLGARGLHGEGYLGHVFWDELFVLPMIVRRFPAVARSLLSYRWRRLGRARLAAAAEGRRGARFPWQSASDGREETPFVLYNPRSGHWMEDRSRYQRHVGLAVAYNFWQYFEATGDEQHLFEAGAEVILEVARYVADLASFDEALGRYRIRGVMGPDEFHDGYPWLAEPGVDDNAYTNVMAAWLLARALAVVELLHRSGEDEVLERIGFDATEQERFEDVSRRLHVPFLGDVLAQFEGWDRLAPLDLDAYRARYGDLARLDLILEAEGDSVRRYQVAKQPDVLMLLYLFSAEELRSVLGRLGYRFDAEAIRRTVEHYSTRVTHGSSLSRVVHAWVNARLDRRSSWDYLYAALRADVMDANGGTTSEGIHLGAMAGTIDLFERCYPGLEIRSDALWLNPSLPEALRSITFQVSYRGHLLAFEIDHDEVVIEAPAHPSTDVTVLISGEPCVVRAGQRVVHELARRPAPDRTP